MTFDLRIVPFSRFGSYMAVSHLDADRIARRGTKDMAAGLYLRTLHGEARSPDVFHMELTRDGRPVAFREEASPSVLRLVAGRGAVEMCLPQPGVLRIRGLGGVGLRLTLRPGVFVNAVPVAGGRWQVNAFINRQQYGLMPLAGELKVDAPWTVARCERVVADWLPGDDGTFEGAIEEFESAWTPGEHGEPFDEAVRRVDAEFAAFHDAYPPVAAEYRQAAELAAYINWMCVVEPAGHLTRPTMLMSKNWMANVWSWDHCFNAMALAEGSPHLAWDQMMVLFDAQHPVTGALPDAMNDRSMLWAFVKPPVHGWALRWMFSRNARLADTRRLKEVFAPLARWTEWWFTWRDSDGDGLPEYHHGNDSGWDNGTVFDAGLPVEGPDLAAYLILQMDVLADMAARLGRSDAADAWKRQADVLLGLLIDHSWRGDRFAVPRSGDHAEAADSHSLLPYLPLVLGRRLPEPIRRTMIESLAAGGLLTDHGPATEAPDSPLYEPDGYWRGPIWAPTTLLIVDGLLACGEADLARRLAKGFCDMAAEHGMAENYDALTGQGLRDRAYTWTASVFLILAAWLKT
ncbi:MAG: hypothetical protein GX591_18320 [Planctomycetes bacterium]|nr:hypothetical protein [Planctomycetota bacterium]